MARLIARLALVVGLACAAAIALARAQRDDHDPVRSMLAPTDDCPPGTPCWMGITPGVTTAAEAAALLRAHPWVSRVVESEHLITWSWNGRQPAAVDARQDGLLGLRGGRVQTMRVQTMLPFGEVWAALDAPDTALLVRPVSRSVAFQIVTYGQQAVQVISSLGCPARPGRMWFGAVSIGRGALWTTEIINGFDFDVYQSPGWWEPVRRCRPPASR